MRPGIPRSVDMENVDERRGWLAIRFNEYNIERFNKLHTREAALFRFVKDGE